MKGFKEEKIPVIDGVVYGFKTHKWPPPSKFELKSKLEGSLEPKHHDHKISPDLGGVSMESITKL